MAMSSPRSASPGTSTPSQNVAVPSSTARPASRTRNARAARASRARCGGGGAGAGDPPKIHKAWPGPAPCPDRLPARTGPRPDPAPARMHFPSWRPYTRRPLVDRGTPSGSRDCWECQPGLLSSEDWFMAVRREPTSSKAASPFLAPGRAMVEK